MELINRTRYGALHLMGLDRHGYEIMTVVVKATHRLRPKLELCDLQQPIALADEYYGEPGRSSLKQAAETAQVKTRADVVVTGVVYPLERRRAEGAARLRCADIDKTLVVVGERAWEQRGGSYVASPPRPFESLRLKYEHAFGGFDDSTEPPEHDPANPVGRGFRATESRRPIAGTLLPCIELPAGRMRTANDRTTPAGFGPIAPHWQERRRFGGTLDETWRATRAPLLPSDFDERFHQVAPADQQLARGLHGGEPIDVQGMRSDGPLGAVLPKIALGITLRFGRTEETFACPCDTVTIDTDRAELSMVFRATVRVHGRLRKLLWICVRSHA